MSNDTEKPVLEFPCDYPIKVMGENAEDFRDMVVEIMEVHAPGFDREAITVRDSRTGKWLSVTVTITATGEEQLKAIFEDLKATGRVQMVL